MDGCPSNMYSTPVVLSHGIDAKPYLRWGAWSPIVPVEPTLHLLGRRLALARRWGGQDRTATRSTRTCRANCRSLFLCRGLGGQRTGCAVLRFVYSCSGVLGLVTAQFSAGSRSGEPCLRDGRSKNHMNISGLPRILC